MALFGKSKEEKELEREMSYRKAKVTLNRYIQKCQELQNKYLQSGVSASKINDEGLVRQFALGYLGMSRSIDGAQRLMLLLDGVNLRREQVKVASEFIGFADSMSKSIFEGASAKDIAKMQNELGKALAKGDQLSMALDTTMETLSDSITSGVEAPSGDIAKISEMFSKGATEPEVDKGLDEGLRKIEEEMRREAERS